MALDQSLFVIRAVPLWLGLIVKWNWVPDGTCIYLLTVPKAFVQGPASLTFEQACVCHNSFCALCNLIERPTFVHVCKCLGKFNSEFRHLTVCSSKYMF